MKDAVSFEDFCASFGFKNYPFNSFTAENERDKQADLFVATQLYSPLFEAFDSGQTMLLSGDRGTGKTSITYDFVRRAGDSALVCQIDDFSNLPKGYSEQQFYRFTIANLVNEFFRCLPNLRKANKALSEDERILLTYYYLNFASDATRGLAQRAARSIQISPIKKFGISIYNFFRNPLNVATNAGVSILADVISKSVGTSNINATVASYFPEIAAGVQTELPEADATLEALKRFAQLARKVGHARVILIFDKIDEDQRFGNAAEEISDFISPIATNNKFLLSEDFQVIISVWIVPLNFIRDRIRTQKIHSPEIKWENEDLRKVYNKRVEVFSNGKAFSFEQMFEANVTTEQKIQILELCNRNPRDLWHLMNRIFRAQYAIDERAKLISDSAIEQGMRDFVSQFNFYEYYPRKANARANSMDVYAYIRHLLRLESPTFTRNQLNERARTGSSTQNYTVGMENLGLIEKDVSDKGEISYKIRDPKVRFALATGIEITKT